MHASAEVCNLSQNSNMYTTLAEKSPIGQASQHRVKKYKKKKKEDEEEEEEEEEEKEKEKKKNIGHLATFWFSIMSILSLHIESTGSLIKIV